MMAERALTHIEYQAPTPHSGIHATGEDQTPSYSPVLSPSSSSSKVNFYEHLDRSAPIQPSSLLSSESESTYSSFSVESPSPPSINSPSPKKFLPPPRHPHILNALQRASDENLPKLSRSSSAASGGSGRELASYESSKVLPKTWKERASDVGKAGFDKAVKVSDWAGNKANNYAESLGAERFYPTTGDFPQEMDKCANIIRNFTVDGIVTETKENKKGLKTQSRIIKKIPAKVFQECKGIAVFTSMRMGMAPFGGAGGAGVVVAHLPDGSWSAPSAVTPNNMTAGFMFGMDVFDCILIIRTEKALESFSGHKATLGGELGVSAGHFGAGAAMEMGVERAPVLSYVKSRGLYAGIELVGQVFIHRWEENENMYYWPGIKPKDILEGKVRIPPEAINLQNALEEATSGVAQKKTGPEIQVEIVEEPSVVTPEMLSHLQLNDNEVLKLPPTPSSGVGEEWDDDDEVNRRDHKEEEENAPSYRSSWGSSTKTPPLPSRFG